MGIVLSLLLSLAIIGGGGAFVRHVARNVTPQPVRRQASARVRGTARTARGKLPPAVQKQLERAVKAQVTADIKQHLAGTIPVIRKAAAQARAKTATAKPAAAKPAAAAAPAGAKPRPLRSVPPLTAVPATAPVPARTMRPDHPAPVPPARKDPPVTTQQAPVTAAGSSGAGADLFAAMRVLVTHAVSGGLQSKQRGLATLAEVLEYQAAVLDELAQRLAEPDQGYPASVWEPVTTSAAHVRGAQSKLGEASSALTHLVSLSLGEASATGQKIPHHEQINSGT